MRKTLIVLTAVLLASTTTVWALPSFTGSLSTPAGVTATPLWDHPSGGFKISWTIDQMGDGSWCYDYLLTNATGGALAKEPSHIIFQISPNAVANDFWNFYVGSVQISPPAWEIDTFSGANPSNPGMPGALYGVKMDVPDGYNGEFRFSFYSSKSPTWGDFYAKDGKHSGSNVIAYNSHFLDPDPTAPAQSGLLTDASGAPIYKILRPDTETDVVPEPTTMLLLGSGLAGLGLVRRWRKQA